jgi:hypothetical protein
MGAKNDHVEKEDPSECPRNCPTEYDLAFFKSMTEAKEKEYLELKE